MEIVRQGEGSGVEKEVMGNMQHQLQLLSQVIWYGPKGYYIMELTVCVFERTSQNAWVADSTTFCMGINLHHPCWPDFQMDQVALSQVQGRERMVASDLYL